MSIPLNTIEDKRKSLAFLETLPNPSETVLAMIREFRAEIAAHEGRKIGRYSLREYMEAAE